MDNLTRVSLPDGDERTYAITNINEMVETIDGPRIHTVSVTGQSGNDYNHWVGTFVDMQAFRDFLSLYLGAMILEEV